MKFAFLPLYLNAVDLGQSCLKADKSYIQWRFRNTGFYCLSSLCFFVVAYLILLVSAYTKCYNMIIGKKVFLCGKNIFQNINGLIYFGYYLLFWHASILVTMICFLSIIKKSLFEVVSGDLYLHYITYYLLISLLSRIENKD